MGALFLLIAGIKLIAFGERAVAWLRHEIKRMLDEERRDSDD